MNVPPVLALALVPMLMPYAPLLAQTQPIRVVNAAPVSATGLYLAPTGTSSWGGNLLGVLTLRPGAFMSVQPGDGGGCRFDVRLVLRDGREALRNDVDVCAERVITMAPDAPPPTADTPAATARPPAVPGARP
ncbi:hypothetical protein [Roseomonas fluvialis]|uniref:Uncharacterized protein n=1 Tax=Roseomonas fluvialis TaxID=1750527 RepID=A0ABM7Y7Y6_9PROT|nr:hypothetical protein [Roseomonas fluvialis]BDG74711.1 hypothetical protein Rmf_46400 [Roseomonas fluvialis]